MSSKCEKQDCNNDRSCFHYCSKHHQEICMKGIVSRADFASAMQARIEKLETAASQAVAWLNHYPSPDNKEEQAESNRRRALNILEKALTK